MKGTIKQLNLQGNIIPAQSISGSVQTAEKIDSFDQYCTVPQEHYDFEDFIRSAKFHIIPAGEYFINDTRYQYEFSVLGDGNISSSEIWRAHNPAADITDNGNIGANMIISKDFASDERVTPSIVAISRIQEDNNSDNGNTNTAFANIYSYIEQTGKESQKYCKAIAGVTVNASGGDNDSSAVVGYSYKKDIPENGDQKAGIGDTVGTGGAAYQYSRQKGLVMGGEFSAHQNVSGTSASPVATANNQTICLHVTTNSGGSPVWSGISIDAQDTVKSDSTHYGYWNAISIMRSCFAQSGEGYVPGTVGISMANCKKQYPDKAIYLGNANYHLYRSNGRAIRAQCSSFDISSGDNHSAGVRVVAKNGLTDFWCYKNGNTVYYTCPNPSEKSNVYQLVNNDMTVQSSVEISDAVRDETDDYIEINHTIYTRYPSGDRQDNISSDTGYLGFYQGNLGADGGTELDTKAMIVNVANEQNNQLYFRVYPTDNGNYVGIAVSYASNSLRPLRDNQMSLGHANYRWKDIYVTSGAISTSDRNQKEEIEDIDERLFKAWSKVNYKVFKFKNGKRKHFGLIAQEVDQAFQSEGLNARDYGLFCEDKDENGNIILGLRYSECLALECAYLRHKIEGV